MNRKDIIMEALRRHYEVGKIKGEEVRMDSVELAEELGYDRSNVSRDLNELVREGEVIKSEGRPVYFYPKEYIQDDGDKKEEHSDFFFMLGEQESLKLSIQQAKSAVLYPPHGLHTLLTGATGTGKSTFAERMYEYAKYMKAISERGRFIVFNCAEYAENPQLLLSQLFGHKKGSFTGADKDKTGLVDAADGGILFLDEIHRLPADGQEMLFLLMDKGIYRRLGETEGNHKANVMIIGATTEQADTALLKTFLRRMPVVIRMPSLTERTLTERLKLIENFFVQEQKNIGEPVKVDKEVLLALLTYECQGNIGQLKADIQMVCARAFLDYKSSSELCYVEVSRKNLPDYIWLEYKKHRNQTNDLILFLENDDTYEMRFPKESNEIWEEDIGRDNSICINLSQRYNEFKKQGKSSDEIKGMLGKEIEEYTNDLLKKYKIEGQKSVREAVLKIIDPKIYSAVTDALTYASVKLEREFSDTIHAGMAMHVQDLVRRIKENAALNEEDINQIVLRYPRELKTAKGMKVFLEEELNIKIPISELNYLTLFLCEKRNAVEEPRIGLIVVSHGDSTASSMAKVANSMLGTKHCRSIDMPLEVSVRETFEKVKRVVEQEDKGTGVLLLVDMGSLIWFSERISEETGHEVKSLEMVSTVLVIEALRKILIGNYDLKELYEELHSSYLFCSGERMENIQRKRAELVVTCISGQGTAVRIGKLIKASFEEEPIEIELIYMSFKDKNHVKDKLEDRGIYTPTAVVGTVDMEMEGVPYISLEELIAGEGIHRLHKLVLVNDSGEKDIKRQEKEVALEMTLDKLLVFLDAGKMAELTVKMYERTIEKCNLKKDLKIKFRYVIHVSCMAERLIQNNVFMNSQTEQLKHSTGRVFTDTKEILQELDSLIGIEVPDSEVAYVVELLTE